MSTCPESTGPNPSPIPPKETGSPLDAEVHFLRELERLAAARAAVESQIVAQYRARGSAAIRSFDESRRALDAWLGSERRDASDDYAQQQQHAMRRWELESDSVRRKFAAFELRLGEEFEAATERADRRLEELRWEAETLFEASQHVAPKQVQQLERSIASSLERIRDEQRLAERLLETWRQPVNVPQWPAAALAPDGVSGVEGRLQFVLAQRARLAALRVPPLAVSLLVIWVFVVLGVLLSALAVANGWGVGGVLAVSSIVMVLGWATRFFLRELARSRIKELYLPLCGAASQAENMAQHALEEARAHSAARHETLLRRRQHALEIAHGKHERRAARARAKRDARLEAARARLPIRMAAIDARRQRDLELAEQIRARREAEIRQKATERIELAERYQQQSEQIEQQHAAQWQALGEKWLVDLARMQSIAAETADSAHVPGHWLANWDALANKDWAAETVPAAIRFGQLDVRLDQIEHGTPHNSHLVEIGPNTFTLPALVPFPERPSVLIKARGSSRAAVSALEAVMLRLLVTIPPGKLRFTIIDPVALGEHFAAFMHLADFNEALITHRIWTDPRHIEERLGDLSEHLETVIQKYLRNEFESIAQYNHEAGEIAEPFRFLVIADFPAHFSEAAARRLMSIVASGARCGVYTLIVVDTQVPLPAGISLDEIERHSATLVEKDGRFVWKDDRFGRFALTLDLPPPPAQTTEILQTAGQYANRAARVELPFEAIAPRPGELWTSSARMGIDVPLGRVGASRLQSLKLGEGTSQHVLVSGKTGSGKSTLLHALVTNLALRYSPDEVELYLVDFKQGVEFKTYATHRLPHARVVAIESDREFGLSVLARLDAELKQRADRFRALGVQDLAGFRQAEAAPLARILLIVDEFQEFFVEDDKISQEAALLLDRLVRQGRAFGIHVLLGSQTLAGTYSLARSTIGQMAVRIALQCSEADSHLILSEDNTAARLLSRAGEAIYNDSNGLVQGNHPFQVVWLADEKREKYLEQIALLASARGQDVVSPIIFEGNVPADPEQNAILRELLSAGRPRQAPPEARAWLGDAVEIKDPTSVSFRNQGGSNVLIVGQNEELALGMFASALVSLSAQYPAPETTSPRFYVFDGSPAGSIESAMLARLLNLTPDAARVVAWREVPTAVNELAWEVERRQKLSDGTWPAIFVFVYGLHKLRDLRRPDDDLAFARTREEDSKPSRQFSSILREGPAVGVHALVWCDSVNNLHRTWDRQTLREFELRVALQMSGNDSSTLIDSPLAAKLGPHRALFHREEQGSLEKFRPYRRPGEGWLDWVRQQLHGADGQPGSLSQRMAV